MSEMEQARIKSTNLDYLNKLTKLDLLVIVLLKSFVFMFLFVFRAPFHHCIENRF